MIGSVNNVRIRGDKDWLKNKIPSDALNLLRSILQFNPKKRPTAIEIL